MSGVEQNLDTLFKPDADLEAAYGQSHDAWFSAEPGSQGGKRALAAKQNMITVLAEQGKAPGQIDEYLIPETTDEERENELAELRKELGINDVGPLWQPTSEEECDKIGNKFLALDEEEIRIKKQYAARLKKVADKRDYLHVRYSEALDNFRAKQVEGKKQKFVDLPSCRLQSRTVPQHYKVYDEKMLEESLKQMSLPDLEDLGMEVKSQIVSTDKRAKLYREADRRWIMKAAAMATLEVTGDVVKVEPLLPGIERIPEHQKFSVTVAK